MGAGHLAAISVTFFQGTKAQVQDQDKRVLRVFGGVKYISIGFLFWIIGSFVFGESLNFVGRSEPATLRVLEMETRREPGGEVMFRPVFALDAAKPPLRFAGEVWHRPAPHQAGEIVAGRYDASSGEMRSDKMLRTSLWMGRIARLLAVLIGLQAVALLLGVPEEVLPLRVRIGTAQRRRVWP